MRRKLYEIRRAQLIRLESLALDQLGLQVLMERQERMERLEHQE